jgi:Leucine-rich repeat (LRR) protein
VLSLWKNEISGRIPTELFGIGTLEELHLQDNLLQGDLPSAVFRELGNLTQVVLSQNNFSGTLPVSIGHFSGTRLDVSFNRLIGTLPKEIFGLSRLNYLQLADNNVNR